MSGKANQRLMSRLALAMAKGASCRAACKALGVGYRNAKRWTALPEFQQKLISFETQINTQIINRYRVRMLKTFAALCKIIDDPETDRETAIKAGRGQVADFIALSDHLKPGGQSARPGAPGLVVPGLDPRWAPGATEAEGGGECSTPTE